VEYLVYFWPGVLYIVLPVACLIAGIVTFTILGRNGEVVAITALGISVRRAVVPVLGVTALCCLVLFLVQDRVAPASNRQAQAIRDQITGRTPRSHGQPVGGTWTFGAGGRRLYHYRLYDPTQQVFQAFSVFTLDRQGTRILDHRFSRRARWTGSSWELEDGWCRAFPTGDGPAPYEVYERAEVADLDAPSNFVASRTTLGSALELPEQLSLAEIRDEMRALLDRGYDVTRLRVAYHGKFAQALSPLVMVVLGLPFAFRVGRHGSLYGIGIAILLVLVYWAVFAVFNALGLETLVSPLVAAWGPNVLFGLTGMYLLLFVRT
jgi:LPS export ABC transporter permease LptG